MLNCTRASGLTFLFPEGDTVVGQALQRYGEFAGPEVDFLVEAATAAEGRFLDIGANIGAIALPFARRAPGWRVTAVEPHRGLCSVLAANTHANHLENVEVVNAAAGAVRTIVDFPTLPLDQKLNFGDSGFHQNAPLTPVLQLPADALGADAAVIKVDVQGFEAEVLKGSSEILRTGRALWFIEKPATPESRREVFETLQAAGCEIFWFFSPFGTRRSPRPRARNDRVNGDDNWVATPAGVSSPWPLTRVADAEEPRPHHVDAYPYLRRYGLGA
ncbi:FkbM family methyltransferase [Phenylobacterium sp. VNQ135]|uniref:FkbM family methyltransferase n=1 Tax=Phenylobacterium sp. VNQ135 TaxID=3400922 RepID=UPI003C023DCA